VTEKDLFTTAREMTDPAARSAYLDGACDGDRTLRDRVEALLRASDQPDSLLDQAANATVGLESGAPTDDEIPLGFLAPSTRPDALGRIGHYDVLEVLGKGAFGIVFRAFDDVLQRVVAVKVLAPQLAATSPARKRFLREARTSAAIRHENVVQVHAVEEKPLPYLVMEFIPGETLQQKLDRVGPLDVPETLRIGRQIADGLTAAHAADLIHRDIKPGNILLEGVQQKAKLTDFGLARAADDASISQSGIIAGTPMYMAPEQALGHRIDQRADLFSLGSVLYQMVAGRPPFRANSTVAVLKRVAEDTPRDIREIIPETPQWLCDIISKLHAKNPDDRYQTAREVADVLADCEAQLKANSKLKDYSRIPCSKPRRSGRRKWVAAAAVSLPVLALAVTEIVGVTHLVRKPQPTVAAEPKTPLVAGRFALAFDGKTSLVSVPSLIFKTDHALTVEAWGVLDADQPHSCDLLGNAGGQGFTLYVPLPIHEGDGMRLAFAIRLKDPDRHVLAWEKQPVPRHELVHVAGVYDGKAEIRIYIDGQLQSRAPVPNVKLSRLPLTLGNNYLGRSGFLGRMNEVRISKVARYDADFTPAVRWEPDADTLALYHFDEGEGSVLKDSSGNGHDGKIIGAKWVKADGSPTGATPSAAPTPAIAPFTDADVQRIAVLPAAEQVEEVRKELMRRNPDFDGAVVPEIDAEAVTGFRFISDRVADITPVRALTHLHQLNMNRLELGHTKVPDLTPLKGIPLESLHLWTWPLTDLTPLKDMPLKWLNCGGGFQKLDLTPLSGMPLNYLCVNLTQVSDLRAL
jgi:serine/threonine protein kinase